VAEREAAGGSLGARGHRVLRWRPGGYLRASGELFVWLGLRAAAQVLMVFLLARALGAQGYGQFVTVLAVASFLAPLVGLGTPGVVLRDGARRPQALPHLLRACLALWRRSLLIVALLSFVIVWFALPNGTAPATIAAFVLSELIGSSLAELIGRAEQARHRTRAFGLIQAGLIFVRLAALVLYLLTATLTPEGWMLAYAAASLVYSAALWAWMQRQYPRVSWRGVGAKGEVASFRHLMREGLPFLTGALSFRLQAEFNKPVLAQLGYAQAGQFGLAQRALDLASLPLVALQEALWPRVFSSNNPKGRLFASGAALVVLAFIGGLLLAWFAPWLPRLLGEDYAPAAEVLMWLAALPAVQVVRNLGNIRLLAEGRAQMLTVIYGVTTLGSVTATAVLVSRMGLPGAVVVAYGTEALAILIQEVSRWKR